MFHSLLWGTWEDSRRTGNFNVQSTLTSPSEGYSDGHQLRFYPLQHTSGPFLRFGSYKTGRLIFWTDLEAHGVVQTVGGRCHWAPSQSLPERQQWPDAAITQPQQSTSFCHLDTGLRRNRSATRTMALLHFAQWTRTQTGSSGISLDVQRALLQLNNSKSIWKRFALLITSLPMHCRAAVEVLNVNHNIDLSNLSISLK